MQADPKRFDNYRIFRVAIDSLKQLDALRDNSFYFIDEPSNVGQEVQVIIAPHQQSLFDGLIKRVALKSQLLVSNVQSLIDQEQRQELFRGSRYNVEAYHRVDEMYAWLDSLAVTYPKIVTRIKGGDTYQNRSIEGVKLSKNPNNPAIFIESNIHAREWLTSASTNWIINELLTSSDPEIQALLNNYNWYIFPVVNPDGYEYSHTDNRLWRKTRSPNGDDSECVGTDANRNFDSHWGGRGSSKDPCDNTYAGSSVFSEVEMRTLSQYAMSLKDEVKVYLAFHSAARMILSPWGHTSALPDNHDDLLAIMTTAYARLNAVHGTHYIFGNSCKTICKSI